MGCNLIVDLFGEQAVQVMIALLSAACVLLLATMVVLSVRSASAGMTPARAAAATQICLNAPAGITRLSDQALQSELPARAPPDPAHRHAQPAICG